MEPQTSVLLKTNNFPIRHEGNIHDGKVRSVYWLSMNDSRRLIENRGYNVNSYNQLGLMVISDRISAFDVNWGGIPGKGASLNVISKKWFDDFGDAGLADNHVLEVPHPLVWIVQRADPIMVEAIARQYITGSMWRAYEKGEREFCGVHLPNGLREHQRLDELLFTPTTKGTIRGVPDIEEEEDAKLSKGVILRNYKILGFELPEDVGLYERLLREGFELISKHLEDVGELFIDTKFELGYARGPDGISRMVYIDEVGTPDSSRMWNAEAYRRGNIVEDSKEGFRQFLLGTLDSDILLNGGMDKRRELARSYAVPERQVMEVSDTYRGIAEKIIGHPVKVPERPREEILDALSAYGIIE